MKAKKLMSSRSITKKDIEQIIEIVGGVLGKYYDPEATEADDVMCEIGVALEEMRTQNKTGKS